MAAWRKDLRDFLVFHQSHARLQKRKKKKTNYEKKWKWREKREKKCRFIKSLRAVWKIGCCFNISFVVSNMQSLVVVHSKQCVCDIGWVRESTQDLCSLIRNPLFAYHIRYYVELKLSAFNIRSNQWRLILFIFLCCIFFILYVWHEHLFPLLWVVRSKFVLDSVCICAAKILLRK